MHAKRGTHTLRQTESVRKGFVLCLRASTPKARVCGSPSRLLKQYLIVIPLIRSWIKRSAARKKSHRSGTLRWAQGRHDRAKRTSVYRYNQVSLMAHVFCLGNLRRTAYRHSSESLYEFPSVWVSLELVCLNPRKTTIQRQRILPQLAASPGRSTKLKALVSRLLTLIQCLPEISQKRIQYVGSTAVQINRTVLMHRWEESPSREPSSGSGQVRRAVGSQIPDQPGIPLRLPEPRCSHPMGSKSSPDSGCVQHYHYQLWPRSDLFNQRCS